MRRIGNFIKSLFCHHEYHITYCHNSSERHGDDNHIYLYETFTCRKCEAKYTLKELEEVEENYYKGEMVFVEEEPELSRKSTMTQSPAPPKPPTPPFRTMGAFGETKESKKARAKYEEDLRKWEKEMEIWKKTYGSNYYVSIY